MPEEKIVPIRTKQILGIKFFDASAEEAVAYAAPRRTARRARRAFPHCSATRRGISARDGRRRSGDRGQRLDGVFWRLLRGERLNRISGLTYFKRLLERPESRSAGKLFWILPSEKSKTTTLAWSRSSGFPTTAEDCYVAPRYETRAEDETLLAVIRQRQPAHIIVAIGGGMQDKIGSYLKHQCGYRPAIHCIGAAPGFVTGDQIRIPMWADRFYLGWIFRVFAQPRVYFKRYWKARIVARLISRYGREMPPLIPS